MDAAPVAQSPRCSQCGGELHPDEGRIFLICPYCSSSVYLDKSRVVFHWSLAPTLDEGKARAALMRWMAGNQTVKDLDKKATISSVAFEYFPMWYIRHRQPDGSETVSLTPAAATSITEIQRMNLPAGDLQKYDPSLDSQAHTPSVPLEAALSWLGEQENQQIQEQSLVHIPVYTFKYSYRNNLYTAVVEAATGSTFANIYPAKAETPYRAMGCSTAAIFLILAFIPIAGAISNDLAGTGVGLAICIGLGLIFVPILFAIAATIASKV
jgi:hypothetical protein